MLELVADCVASVVSRTLRAPWNDLSMASVVRNDCSSTDVGNMTPFSIKAGGMQFVMP